MIRKSTKEFMEGITPESLINSKRWKEMLTSNICGRRLKGLVVDEAHCVSKW